MRGIGERARKERERGEREGGRCGYIDRYERERERERE